MSTGTLSQDNRSTRRESIGQFPVRILAGGLAGVIAGLLYQILLNTQGMSPMLNPAPTMIDYPVHLLLSALAGVVFCLSVGSLAHSPGSSMVWGVAYGLILWFIGPLTLFPSLGGASLQLTADVAHDAFPLLIGLVVSYGASLGLLYMLLERLLTRQLPSVGEIVRRSIRAVIAGSIAGLLGGLFYGRWTVQVDNFPLLAGFVGSDAVQVGYAFHLLVAIIIGASYGLLFRDESKSLGPSLIRGVVYGMIWWIVGPLTIMPILLGDGVQWSLEAGQATYGALIGHIIYGIVLAFFYTLLSRLHDILLVNSDPLKREPESPGTRIVRALLTGALASIGGGLLFTVVLYQTESLPFVGRLGGMESLLGGFAVHMLVSAIIGSSYGFFFHRVATSYGSAMLWGLAYGQLWWFLGPLTLMPWLLGRNVTWSLDAAAANYPSLIGHLAYGATIALTFFYLAKRHDPAMQEDDLYHPDETVSPALWIAVVLPGVLIPLLLTI